MIKSLQKIAYYVIFRMICVSLFLLAHCKLYAQSPISSGYSHSLYLCPEGEIYSWGDNMYGQLGWGSYDAVYQNFGKITSLRDIRYATAGGFHSLAIRKDSSLWSWGLNNYGQLGNDDYCSNKSSNECINNIIPLRVEGGETGDKYLQSVVATVGGLANSYALLSNGEVVAWGDNSFGQLGNGNKTTYWVPRYVRSSSATRLKHIKAIATSGYFACALDSSGTVWAWGDNEYFQLACGASGAKSFAQAVITHNGERLSNIIKIAAGLSHALFLARNGTVYASGQYKGIDNDFTPSNYAQQVAGGATRTDVLQNITDISAGMVHSLAIQKIADGSNRLLSWGSNRFYKQESSLGGQLGLGSIDDRNRSEPDFVLLSNNDIVRNIFWMTASYGNSFTMAYNDFDGQATVYASGINNSYQLGFGNVKSVFRATEILLPDCKYNCSTAFLGKDLQVCNPFSIHLRSGSKSVFNIYTWKRNDTLLADTTSSITTSKAGIYTLSIRRRAYDCGVSSDTIQVLSHSVPFKIIARSFCADSLHLSVIGTEQFSWWNAAYYGQKLSEKSWVKCDLFDSYQPSKDTAILWLESESCQRLPVIATKNCNCSVASPTLRDTSLCISSTSNLHLYLDSVIWYKNRNRDTILGFQTLRYDVSTRHSTQLYASKWDAGCESKHDSFRVSVVRCLPYYRITGTIIPAIPAKVYLYDTDSLPIPSDSIILTSGSTFDFLAQQGEKTIQVVPYDTINYTNTWFYNSRTLKNAKTLSLIANISNVQIFMQAKTDIAELQETESLSYPNPCKTDVYVNVPCETVVLSVSLQSSDGTSLACAFEQNGNLLHLIVNQLQSGYYHASIISRKGVIHTHFIVK